MLKSISHANLWVGDQDEALAFYTQKLGFEVREDVTVEEFGNFRWLTVGLASQPDVNVILITPETLPMPPETIAKVQEIVAAGAGGGLILTVDDVRATFEELKARGVEFVQEPVEHVYGIDAAFRDPFGNQIRIAKRAEG